jgi:hypothetical protein
MTEPKAELTFEANKLLDCQVALLGLDSDLWDWVLDLLGTDIRNCPFADITYDHYDCSFELIKAKPGLQFSEPAVARIKQAGWARWWICYIDGTESYCGGPVKESHRKDSKP